MKQEAGAVASWLFLLADHARDPEDEGALNHAGYLIEDGTIYDPKRFDQPVPTLDRQEP